jgi:hypothetical protein
MAPFNEVDKFRVLTLIADPPSLAEAELAEIRPLIAAPDEDPANVTYKWSWCPIAVNVADGAACAISEEDFRAMAEMLVLTSGNEQAADLLDTVPISFALGENPTAQFAYALPSDLLAQICDTLMADDTLGVADILNCSEKLDVVIRMEATLNGNTVIAIKEIPLYIDAAGADNENPEILDLKVSDGSGNLVSMDNGPVLFRGETYDLEATIDEGASQLFVPFASNDNPNPSSVREILFMTWYVTGGETDSMRTSYIENEVSMEVLRNNQLTVPGEGDYPDSEIDLFLVLQDERGGAGWMERRFEIEER